MYVMHFLPFITIKAIDVTYGLCEINQHSDLITGNHAILPHAMFLASHVWLTMQYVAISAAVDWHQSQSEDVIDNTINNDIIKSIRKVSLHVYSKQPTIILTI